MSDVTDILGIKAPIKAPKPLPFASTTTKSNSSPLPAKKKKVPRELQALRNGWENYTTAVPTQPIFKAKRSKQVNWKFMPIVSSARRDLTQKAEDDVELNHWVKIHNMPDYRFARFNKKIRFLDYTDEEYEKYLQDPAWSRKQTDKLMELCRQFDLRFIVIHDRFVCPPPSHPPPSPQDPDEDSICADQDRTVEDLKDRFYWIQRQLLQIRNSSDPELQRHPIMMYPYDRDYENERKQQLNRLFKRNKETVNYIATLVLENRKVNQEIKKIKKQTKGNKKTVKKKKHRSGSGPTSQVTPQPSSSAMSPSTPTPQYNGGEENSPSSSQSQATDLSLEGAMLAPIPTTIICPPFPERPSGCYLRSTQQTASMHLNSRQNKRLDQELTALGLKKSKPLSISSALVSNMYDQLRRDLVTLMNLEKYLNRRECHRDNVKLQTYKTPVSSNSSETTSTKQKRKRSSKGDMTAAARKKKSNDNPL